MTKRDSQKAIDDILRKAQKHTQEHEPARKKPSKAQVRKTMRLIERVITQRDTIKQQKGDDPATEWENEFLSGIKGRIKSYGAAFFDPMKGDKTKSLSYLQKDKLREIKKSITKKNTDRRS